MGWWVKDGQEKYLLRWEKCQHIDMLLELVQGTEGWPTGSTTVGGTRAQH